MRDFIEAKGTIFLFVLSGLAGIFVIICGINLLFEHLSYYNEGIKVSAVVVDYSKSTHRSSKKNKTQYYPIVEFKIDGETVRSKAYNNSKTPEYAIGQELDILYKSSIPGKILIDGHNKNIWGPVLVILAGILFFVVSLCFLIHKFRSRVKNV